MSEKKKKRGFFDSFFDFGEEDFLSSDDLQSGGSGYSISVTYDERGKPVVQVKIRGEVDVNELRRDLKERYPDAKIEGLNEKPLIRVIGEDKEPEKKTKERKSKKSKKDEKPLMRVIE